jgi:hypothetical protein
MPAGDVVIVSEEQVYRWLNRAKFPVGYIGGSDQDDADPVVRDLFCKVLRRARQQIVQGRSPPDLAKMLVRQPARPEACCR